MGKLKALKKILVPATMVTAILFSYEAASLDVLAKKNENIINSEEKNLNQELESILKTNSLFSKIEFSGEKSKVKIIIEGEQKEISTNAKTVSAVLFESGVDIKKNDEVYPSLSSEIKDGQEILIITKNDGEFNRKEPIPFNVSEEFSMDVLYGERKVIQAGQEGEKILHFRQEMKNGIIISEEKYAEEVSIYPVEEKVIVGLKEVVQENIDFKTITRENPELEQGKSKVVQSGSYGIKETIYSNDGQTRTLVSSEMKQMPEDKIIEVGTKKVTQYVATNDAPTSAKYTLQQFKFNGVVRDAGRKFTYYSQSVLPGGGLKIPGRHVNSAGYVSDGSGYIVLAAGRGVPKGTVINTPFGYQGKVYDTCASCDSTWFDVYIR